MTSRQELLVVIDAEPHHVAAITRIDAHYVAASAATFEEEVPDEAEMRSRFDTIRDQGLARASPQSARSARSASSSNVGWTSS